MSAQEAWKVQDAFREKGKIVHQLRAELANRDRLLDLVATILNDEGIPAATRIISVTEFLSSVASTEDPE